ncbi:MAG: exonuclease SbcCD subunit D [Oscillospiraceae bacterium]
MDINNISYHKDSPLLKAKSHSENGITIIHCSDIHLGASIPFLKDADAKIRRSEIMNTFKKITEICKERNVDVLLIAGDLFENHGVDVSIINFAKQCFLDIPDTIVSICGGNHDYISADCPLCDNNWSKNVFIFGKEIQSIEFPNMKLRLWGTSFTSTYMEMPRFDKINVPKDDYINIMVMHGDLLENENQVSRYNPITLEQIGNSNMDYLALGHIHKTTPIKKSKNTFYAYSGCPEGHGFDEQGQKGIYYGTISKGKCDLQLIPISKRVLIEINLDITSATSDSDVIGEIKTYLKRSFAYNYYDNLYKIVLDGFTDENYIPNCQNISSVLSELVFYCDVTNHSLPKIDFKLLSKEVSLKGVFVKNMLDRINKSIDDFEKESLKKALYVGLNAFDKEVIFNDN